MPSAEQPVLTFSAINQHIFFHFALKPVVGVSLYYVEYDLIPGFLYDK